MTDDGNRETQAESHHRLAHTAYESGDLTAALDEWTLALGLLVEEGDEARAHDIGHNAMMAFLRLGYGDGAAYAGAYHVTEEEVNALRHELAAQHLLPETDSMQQYVYGRELFDAGDEQGAVVWFELCLLDATVSATTRQVMLENLGRAYLLAGGDGWRDNGSGYLRQAGLGEPAIQDIIDEYTAAGRIGGQGQGQFEQGLIAFEAQEYGRAVAMWTEAAAAADVDETHRASIRWSIAQAHVRLGEWEPASDAAKLAGSSEDDLQAEWTTVHGEPHAYN